MTPALGKRTFGPCKVAALVAALTIVGSGAARAQAWTQVGPSDGAPDVRSIAFDAVTPGIAYAGLFGGGVARSSDGGATWKAVTLRPDLSFVDSLMVAPNRTLVGLFEKVDPYDPAEDDSGLYESADGAGTWSRIRLPAAFQGSLPNGWAFDPVDPQTLYAAGWSGLYRTHDRGATWTRLGETLPYLTAYAVAVDPLDPRRLYAGLSDAQDGNGLYISHDDGASWARAREQTAFSIAISPADPQILWAAHSADVVESRDRGVHWSGVLFDGGVPTLLADATDSDTAYVGGWQPQPTDSLRSLVKTTDGGRHWSALTQGLPPQFMTVALAQNPFNPAQLLLATYLTGLFRSQDGGASWTSANAGLVNTDVTALAAAPNGTLYAVVGNRLWRSNRQRSEWTPVFERDWPLDSVAIDPNDPRTIYVGIDQPPDLLVLAKSTDGGTTWEMLAVPGAISGLDLAIDPTDSRTLYLAGGCLDWCGGPGAGGLVYKSNDAGATWTPLVSAPGAFELALDRTTTPSTVYAANCQIIKSVDGGERWTTVLSIDSYCLDHLTVGPGAPSVVYALADEVVYTSAAAGTVYRSNDAGMTWASFSGPDPGIPSYSSQGLRHVLAVEPSDPSVLFEAALANGVARTVEGASWAFLDRSITADVVTLALGPGELLAGTNWAGAFARPLSHSQTAPPTASPPPPCAAAAAPGRRDRPAPCRARRGTAG